MCFGDVTPFSSMYYMYNFFYVFKNLIKLCEVIYFFLSLSFSLPEQRLNFSRLNLSHVKKKKSLRSIKYKHVQSFATAVRAISSPSSILLIAGWQVLLMRAQD